MSVYLFAFFVVVVIFFFFLQNTVDKLVQRANASLLIGTSSWKEQFIDALTVSAGMYRSKAIWPRSDACLMWLLLTFHIRISLIYLWEFIATLIIWQQNRLSGTKLKMPTITHKQIVNSVFIFVGLCLFLGDDNASMDENDGECEEPRPSWGDYVMHFLTLFWKILFAFIPPTGTSIEILAIWTNFQEAENKYIEKPSIYHFLHLLFTIEFVINNFPLCLCFC